MHWPSGGGQRTQLVMAHPLFLPSYQPRCGLVWFGLFFFSFVLSFKKKLSRVPWLTWKILENQEKYLRTNKDSTLTLGTNSAECDQFYSTLTAPRVHILNTGESAIARVAIQFLSCH